MQKVLQLLDEQFAWKYFVVITLVKHMEAMSSFKIK